MDLLRIVKKKISFIVILVRNCFCRGDEESECQNNHASAPKTDATLKDVASGPSYYTIRRDHGSQFFGIDYLRNIQFDDK